MEFSQCAQCGAHVPLYLLDAKPERLAGPDHTLAELVAALDANEDCNRLECQACYGPGWIEGAK